MITLDLDTLGASDARLNRVSFGVSSLTLTLPVPDHLWTAPVGWRDIARVVCDGRVLIEGPCMAPRYDSGDGSRYVQITVNDYWWYLDNTTYLGPDPTNIDTTPGTVLPDYGAASRHRLYARQSVKTQDAEDGVRMTMTQILTAARSAGILPVDIDIRVTASALIPFVTNGSSYASVLRTIQEWAPGSASYFDYTPIDRSVASGHLTDPDTVRPRLVIADPATLPVVTLDRVHDRLGRVTLQPRPDLVPPVVAIVGTDSDDKGGFALVNSIVPRGANLQQPCAVILQLDAGTMPQSEDPQDPDNPDDPEDPDKPRPSAKYKYTNEPVMVVKGSPIPTDPNAARQFWERHVQALKDIPGLVYGALSSTLVPATGDEGNGYSETATRYELVEGQIGNKCSTVKWSKVLYQQDIAYPGASVPVDKAAMFPLVRPNGQHYGIHGMEMITTNVRSHRYRVGGDYKGEDIPEDEDPDEDEPETPTAGDLTPQQTGRYDAAVQSYYDASRHLPYDGTIPIKRLRCDIPPGSLINITSDRPEYEDMRAITQSLELDFVTSTTTLTVGPPRHLSLDKATAKARTMVDQAGSTKEETTPDPTGNTTHSWTSEFPKQRKPQSPGIGPSSKYIPPSAAPSETGEFRVRAVMGDDGKISGYQVYQGHFHGLNTGTLYPCGSGWQDCGDTQVWANLELDRGGNPANAYYSATQGPLQPWRPVYIDDDSNKGIDWSRSQPGYYSYLVATISDGQITQYISSPIGILIYDRTFAF